MKRLKTPSIIQMETVECGAICLAIILSYFKCYIPVEKLREECGVSRDGSKAINMLKVAESYGLKAKGLKKELDELIYIVNPSILHWNFNHFVVLEGIVGNRVYINDPSCGHKILSIDDLDKAFTGVVLTFEVTKLFKAQGKKRNIYKSLRSRFKNIKLEFFYMFLIISLSVIPNLILPVINSFFVNNIILKNISSWFWPILLSIIFFNLLKIVISFIQKYYMYRLESKISISTSSKTFWHLLHLPISFFNERFTGDVNSRIYINDTISKTLSEESLSIFFNGIVILIFIILMLRYNSLITIVGLFILLVNIIFLKLCLKKIIREDLGSLKHESNISNISITGIKNIDTIKSSGSEEDFLKKWFAQQVKVINQEQKAKKINSYISAIISISNLFSNNLLMAFGTFEVMKGRIDIFIFITFQALMITFTKTVHNILNSFRSIYSLKNSLDKIDDIENNVLDSDFNINSVKNKNFKLNGDIELKNVTFGYSKYDEPIIDQFNLKIKMGSKIALVGPSGSGKSTISKLISGIVKPWSGEILFDHVSRDKIDKSILNNSISFIDQEVVTFNGTIKDNITLWDKSLDSLKLDKATKDSELYNNIMEKKEGYDFNLVEGAGLSGGQLQRLEIARALINDPTIIVFDEATSSLDNRLEKSVNENIKKRDITCIVIAHRLSTIKELDEIYVLDRGKITESGTHEVLMNLKGLYFSMVNLDKEI